VQVIDSGTKARRHGGEPAKLTIRSSPPPVSAFETEPLEGKNPLSSRLGL
jgi:hypothetical protein